MTDGDNDQRDDECEVRDLTQIIRRIDIKDPKRKKNEIEMKTTDGKVCRFTEP